MLTLGGEMGPEEGNSRWLDWAPEGALTYDGAGVLYVGRGGRVLGAVYCVVARGTVIGCVPTEVRGVETMGAGVGVAGVPV
jgi:hypothetical protein